MKKILYSSTISIILLITVSLIYLSTIGYETDKFNEFLKKKTERYNDNIEANFEKIKIKIDLKKLNFFITTNKLEIKYFDAQIKIKKIDAYVDLISLILAKPNIKNVFITTEEIKTNNLKKAIKYLKPSNSKRFLINNIEGGNIASNFNIIFDDKNNIQDYEIDGYVKNLNLKIKDFNFQKSSFIFFLNNNSGEIKNLRTTFENFLINSGNVYFLNNEFLTVKGDLKSNFELNKNDFQKYTNFEKNIFNDLFLKGNFINKFQIKFDETLKVKDYSLSIISDLNNSKATLSETFKNELLYEGIDDVRLKNSKLEIQYNSNKNNYLKSSGLYSFNNLDFLDFNIETFFKNKKKDIKIKGKFNQKIKLPIINYESLGNDTEIMANISSDSNSLILKKISFKEKKNLINIENFSIKDNKIKKFGKVSVKTYNNNKLQNDFDVVFGDKTIIKGTKYDAANLTTLLNNKTNSKFLSNLNSEINIKLDEIKTIDKKKLSSFNLIGKIERGKLIKITSKGEFSNNEYLDISLNKDKTNQKKILEIYSDFPEPLLSNFKFFKGLSGGSLLFNSIYDDKISISNLLIENFKVKNAPGLVKLLSLADFGGMVDAMSGEGLSFNTLEIVFEKDEKVLNLKELYAIGPSVSILMEGYIESDTGLVSIRGTMVPAKTLNKFLSKIPVVGKIIIPKDIGEGLFGVSFKMKGTPEKIKTSVNPIKSLTPRFIQKALKKSK